MKANEISRQLAIRAVELAPKLLPEGKRAGNYWQASNIYGGKGQSFYLHLSGARAGNWADAATGEWGDILDLIAKQNNLSTKDAMKHALEMLGNQGVRYQEPRQQNFQKEKKVTPQLIKRLWKDCSSISDVGYTYLMNRGISEDVITTINDLRFMAECQLRENNVIATMPALVGAVRDDRGQIIALHRTYLDAKTADKANISSPKRSLGSIAGHGCWLSPIGKGLVITEGIETGLSIKTVWPDIALLAALSAPNLAQLKVPPQYQNITIAIDSDVSGFRAATKLASKLSKRHVRIIPAKLGDFNDDLVTSGIDGIKSYIHTFMSG